MTQDELRAAAEMVVGQVDLYERNGVAARWEKQAKAVAEEWLAEHPAAPGRNITSEELPCDSSRTNG